MLFEGFFFFFFESVLPCLFVVCSVSVYLEQFGVQQQSVGSLSVVVALFVEVTQLVQVPGWGTAVIYGAFLGRAPHTFNNTWKVNSAGLMRPDNHLFSSYNT